MTTDTELIRPIPRPTFLEYGDNPREVLGDCWAMFLDYVREALLSNTAERPGESRRRTAVEQVLALLAKTNDASTTASPRGSRSRIRCSSRVSGPATSPVTRAGHRSTTGASWS
jgi:hypothetical protein